VTSPSGIAVAEFQLCFKPNWQLITHQVTTLSLHSSISHSLVTCWSTQLPTLNDVVATIHQLPDKQLVEPTADQTDQSGHGHLGLGQMHLWHLNHIAARQWEISGNTLNYPATSGIQQTKSGKI
jgi:hypothetical protein